MVQYTDCNKMCILVDNSIYLQQKIDVRAIISSLEQKELNPKWKIISSNVRSTITIKTNSTYSDSLILNLINRYKLYCNGGADVIIMM